MLRERIVSSIIGVLVIAVCIWAGGWVLKAAFLLLGMIGIYEFLEMMKVKKLKGFYIPTYVMFLIISMSGAMGKYSLLAVFIVLLLYMAELFFSYSEERIIELALSLTAALYLGFGIYFAMEISSMSEYLPAIILALALTWSSDIGGYAVGIQIGRHKMAPALSPGKSWEGAAGCVAFTVIASLVFARATGQSGWMLWAGLGIAASVAAQMGDLLESAFKRYFGVKDSGWIIPGHGGVLDRFDSLLFVLPLVYYAVIMSSQLSIW